MPIQGEQLHKGSGIQHKNCKRHALVKYEFAARVPCPALMGEPCGTSTESYMEIKCCAIS